MWWRGSTLIQERAHPQGVWQRFRMGLALLVTHIVITSWTGLEEPQLGWFLLFLFVGFLALVFARVAYISSRSSGSSPFNARWLAGIALLLGLFLALAALLGSLLTGQFSMVLDLLNLGIRWVTMAVLLLLAIPGMIIGGLLGGLIAWLRDQLGTGETQVVETEQEPLAYLLPEDIPDPQPLSPEIQSLILWAIIAVILVWVFWRLGRRIRHAPLPEINQPESLLEPGEAGKLLRKAFQNSLDDLLARLNPQRRILPAESIRRIYIQLLELFDTLDLPRPMTQTPLEYLPVIQTRMPAVAEDLEIITDAYIRVRYGEVDEADLGVERVERAWQRVVEAGKPTE